jgi:hypothetical protein
MEIGMAAPQSAWLNGGEICAGCGCCARGLPNAKAGDVERHRQLAKKRRFGAHVADWPACILRDLAGCSPRRQVELELEPAMSRLVSQN